MATKGIRSVELYFPGGMMKFKQGEAQDGWVTERISTTGDEVDILQFNEKAEGDLPHDNRNVKFVGVPYQRVDLTKNYKDTNDG